MQLETANGRRFRHGHNACIDCAKRVLAVIPGGVFLDVYVETYPHYGEICLWLENLTAYQQYVRLYAQAEECEEYSVIDSLWPMRRQCLINFDFYIDVSMLTPFVVALDGTTPPESDGSRWGFYLNTELAYRPELEQVQEIGRENLSLQTSLRHLREQTLDRGLTLDTALAYLTGPGRLSNETGPGRLSNETGPQRLSNDLAEFTFMKAEPYDAGRLKSSYIQTLLSTSAITAMHVSPTLFTGTLLEHDMQPLFID